MRSSYYMINQRTVFIVFVIRDQKLRELPMKSIFPPKFLLRNHHNTVRKKRYL